MTTTREVASTVLLSKLPRTVWGGPLARLRREPAVWQVLGDETFLDFAIERLGGQPAHWRPGSLGLLLLESDDHIWREAWQGGLPSDKAARTLAVRAFEALTEAEAALPELREATLAALVLREHLALTDDWGEVVAEPLASPSIWAVPLICLYGLIPDPWPLLECLSPQPPLLTPDRESGEREKGARFLARLLLANEVEPALSEVAIRLGRRLTSTARLELGQALADWHTPALARRVAREWLSDQISLKDRGIPHAPDGENTGRAPSRRRLAEQLAVEIEGAEAHLLAGDEEPARGLLAGAWTSANHLAGQLAGELGRLALQSEDFITAQTAFQEAVKAEPLCPQHFAGLAETLLKLQRPEEAFANLPAQVNHSSLALALARLHAAAGSREDMVSAAERAANLAGSTEVDSAAALEEPDGEVQSSAAELLARGNDFQAAIKAARRACELKPTDAGSFVALANYYLKADRHEEAHETASGAVLLDPHSLAARACLASALDAADRPAESLVHWKAACRLDPGLSTHKLGLARAALLAGKSRLAEKVAAAILTSRPTLPEGDGVSVGLAHDILGQVCAGRGDDDQAIEHFKLGAELAPGRAEVWRGMAAYYRSKGNTKRAIEVLEAGQEAVFTRADALPEDGDRSMLAGPSKVSPLAAAGLLTDLAELYREAGRTGEALSALEGALAIKPGAAELHTQAGALYRKEGHPEKAAESLKRALELCPGDPVATHQLGLTLEAQGQTGAALDLLERAAKTVLTLTDPPANCAQLLLDYGRVCLDLSALPSLPGEEAAKGVRSAIDAFREALARGPESPEILAWSGKAHEAAGEYPSALDAYEQAHRLHPGPTGAVQDLNRGIGRCCLALGQVEAAIAALREALAASAAPPLALLAELAGAYLAAQMDTEAFEIYQRAVESAPGAPALLAGLARTGIATGKTEFAIEAYRRALDQYPDRIKLLADMADLQLHSGQVTDARVSYARALALAPGSAQIHRRAGEALLGLGEHAEALQALEAAARLAPEDAAIHRLVGDTQAKCQQFESAHTAYMRAAELEPMDVSHLLAAGEAMWALNQPDSALEPWEKALQARPDNSQIRARLGKALMQLGKHAQALSELERASHSTPEDQEPVRDAALCAIALGDHDRAERLLIHLTHMAPEDHSAHGLLGEVYLALNRPEKALEALLRATRSTTVQAQYLAGQARALFLLGRTKEAIELAREARSAGTSDPEIQGQAGEVLFHAGEIGDGLAALEAAASGRPDSLRAHLALAHALVAAEEAAAMAAYPDQSLNDDSSAKGELRQTRLLKLLAQASSMGADPDTLRELEARARALWDDPGSVLPELESALETCPTCELYCALATAYRKAGLYSRAREAIHAALDLSAGNGTGPGQAAPPTQRVATGMPLVQPGQDIPPAQRVPAGMALMQLGIIGLEQSDPTSAVSALQRATDLLPDNPTVHYLNALALEAAENLDEAAAEIGAALALRPVEAGWHHRLGQLHAARGDHPAALAHYQQAAEQAPANARWTADLARALARDGDLNAAESAYERASQADPQDPVNWVERGEILLQLQSAADAARCFDQARALNPQNPRVLTDSAKAALALNRPAAARDYVEASLVVRPDDPDALACLAEVEASLGKTEKALQTYSLAARHAANPFAILMSRARLLVESGQITEAVQALWQLEERDPESDEVKELLGEALVKCGRVEDALAAIRQAIAIAPSKAVHHLRLGQIFQQAGQLDQALLHLEDARELAPDDVEVYLEIGRAFEVRRQYDRACEAYQGAIQHRPNDARGYFHAGVALKHLKSYPEAIAMLQRAVELDPKNLIAHRQLAAVSAMGLVYGVQEDRAHHRVLDPAAHSRNSLWPH